MRERHRIFRDGYVHVSARMCKTCIFHDGNRMHLREGRVEQMVAQATRDDSAIVCHSTLDGRKQAVCRGFYEQHPTWVLRLADVLGQIRFVE